MTDAEERVIQSSAVFREAWARHVEGNSFYDLNAMSQPEVDSFRWVFMCGWVAHRDATQLRNDRAD